MDTDALIQSVYDVFPDPGCPVDWLPPCPCDECCELAQFLKERPRWREFSAEDCRYAQCTALMDESFRYYLPAYIVASLTDPDSTDIAMDTSAWRFLSYPPEIEPNHPLFASFDAGQQHVILRWLSWYAETQSVGEEDLLGYMEQVKLFAGQ